MDYQTLYQFFKRRGLSDEEAARRARASATSGLPQTEEQEPVGLVGGIGRGIGETGQSYLGGLGFALDVAGADGLGKELQRRSLDYERSRPELTRAGEFGRVVGRVGSELAGAVLGGGLALKGASKIPAVARALQSGSRLERATAATIANLPVDVAQAAAYRDGAFLEGFGGALAENVLLSGAGSALFSKPGDVYKSNKELEDALREATDEFAERVRRTRPDGRVPGMEYEVPSSGAEPRRGPEVRVGEPTTNIPGALPGGTRAGELPPGQYEMTPRIYPERQLPAEGSGYAPGPYGYRDPTYFEPMPVQGPEGPPPIITPPPVRPIIDPERLIPSRTTRVGRPFGGRDWTQFEKQPTPPIQGPQPRGPLITPPPKPRLEGEQYTLFTGVPLVSPEVLKTEAAQIAIGAGLGASLGGAASEEDPLTGAVLGGLAGAGVAAGARSAFARVASNPASSPEDIARAARETIKRGGTGRVTGKEGPIPSVERGMPDEVLEEYTKRFGERPTTTIGEVQDQASRLDVGEVYRKHLSGRKLDAAEQAALQNEVARLTADWEMLSKQADNARNAGIDRVADATEEAQAALAERMIPLLQMSKGVSDIGSGSGLSMRLLQELYKVAGVQSPSSLRRMTLNALGVKRLVPELQRELEGILRITDEAKRLDMLAKFAQKHSRSSRVEIALDARRAGLLFRPASWLRNIIGTGEVAGAAIVENPVARVMDNLIAKATGTPQAFAPMTMADRFDSYWKGVGKGATDVRQNWRAYLSGIDPEQPLDLIRRRIIRYDQFFGPDAPDFVKGGLRAFQKVNNAVYGVMSASDRLFYEGALNNSLKERAVLRAMSDPDVIGNQIKFGSEDFNKIVRGFMEQPHNDDLVMATFDALDSTYKTTSALSDIVRTAKREGGAVGALTDLLIPFPNTPTNIVKKALERMPIIGLGVGSTYRPVIKRHVARMRREGFTNVSEQAVEQQLKRMWRKLYAKQLTSTVGLAAAGYALHKNGMLTLPYTPTMGATPEERQAALMRGVTGEGSLALKIGGSSYDLGSTLGTIAPLIALGAAWSAAEEDYDGESAVDSAINKFGSAYGAVGQTVLSLPILTGVRDVVETLQGRGMTAPATIGRQIGSFVPASALLGGIARATDPEVGSRKPETIGQGAVMNIPGLSRMVPERVTSLGQVPEGAGPISSIFQPFTERRLQTGQLYDAFRAARWAPTAPGKLEGESEAEYSARRQVEGQLEMQVLERVLQSLLSGGRITLEGLEQDENQRMVAQAAFRRALSAVRSMNSRRLSAQTAQQR